RDAQIIAHPPSPLPPTFSKPGADFRNTLRKLFRHAANRHRTAAEISRAMADCAAAVATKEKAAPDESPGGRAAVAVSFRPTSASNKEGEDRYDRSIQRCRARRSPPRSRAPAPAAPMPERKRTARRRKSPALEIFPVSKNLPAQKRAGANRAVCGSMQNLNRQYQAGLAK